MRTITGCPPHSSLPTPLIIAANRAQRLCYLFCFCSCFCFSFVVCFYQHHCCHNADLGFQCILRPTTLSSRISWTYQTDRGQQYGGRGQDRTRQHSRDRTGHGKGSSDDHPDPDDNYDSHSPCYPLHSAPLHPLYTLARRRGSRGELRSVTLPTPPPPLCQPGPVPVRGM